MQKPANGGLILALGVLSLMGFGFLTGIPAWILGNNALNDIRGGVSTPQEESLVTAGRVLGMVGTILSGLGLLLGIFLFMFMVGLTNAIPHS
jgi:hypothetical protein